jgi:hypothetical protein
MKSPHQPFQGQKTVPVITPEEVAEFDMSRLRFRAENLRHSTLGRIQAAREASLRMMELAAALAKTEIPTTQNSASGQKASTADDATIW